MKIYSNKGMYLETLINRTINFLNNNHLAYFEKRNIPTKIIKNIRDDLVVCKLLAKSTVDYCGVYQNKHLEFEAKQTMYEYFDLDQLKKHQLSFLIKMNNYQKCFCFLLIYFEISDQTILIPIDKFVAIAKTNKTKHIPKDLIEKHGYTLSVVFPGILNLVDCLNQLLPLNTFEYID